MSSHHIIREDQEPALIIANGESCSLELLEQLLEWSPYVLVLDGALHRVIDLGIKFSGALGDWDSVENIHELVEHQHPIDLIDAPNQDKTDLEKGIEHLLQKGHSEIHIVWASGKRLDHTLNNIITLAKYSNQGTLVLFDDHTRAYCIPKTFSKYFNRGTNISLFPMNQCQGITTSGLKYNLEKGSLDLPSRTGSSNETVSDGIVEISYQSGQLILMEAFD